MGRGAANLWFAFPNIYFPWINCAKGIQDPWRPSGTPTEDVYACMDSNGYPTKMPTGVTQFTGFFYGYLIDHGGTDRWCLTWDGPNTGIDLTATTTGITRTLTATSANRREYTFTGSAFPEGKSIIFQLTLSAITEGDTLRNIKVFRKSQETRMATYNWAPHMVELIEGFGRIRFMDFQETNNAIITEWAHRSLATDHSWTGGTLRTAYYAGAATQTSNNYVSTGTITGNPVAWVDGMKVFAKLTNVITSKTVQSMTKGSPTIIGCTGHGFTNGDKVMFDCSVISNDAFGDALNFQYHTITSTGADTFTIPVDSTAFSGSYTANQTTVYKQVTLATSTLPAKRVMNRDSGSIPPSRFAVNDVREFTYSEIFDGLLYTLGPTSGGVGGGGASNIQRPGVPVSLLVELCNEAQVSPHFCIPLLASDDYVEQFATYVKDNLDTDLHAVYELSNEVWNQGAGFLQTGQAWRMSYVLWPGSVNNNALDQTGVSNWYSMRFQEIAAIIDDVYTGLTGRHVKALATWAAMTSQGYRDNRYQAPLASLGEYPILSADEIHIAPYCEPDRETVSNAEQVWKYKQEGDLREEALQWGADYFRSTGQGGTDFIVDYLLDTLFPLHYSDADTYNVKLAWYEGGWGGIPSLCSLTASTYSGDALLTSPITVSGAASAGGRIRLTVSSTASLVDGDSYLISGIFGTSEANFLWEINVIDATHIDLVNSVFFNTYVSGGVVESDRDAFFYGMHASQQWDGIAHDLMEGFRDIDPDVCVYPSYYTLVASRGSSGIWGTKVDTVFGTAVPADTAVRRFNANRRRYRIDPI